jgi:hypothetical protein
MRHSRRKNDVYPQLVEDRLADLMQLANIDIPAATIKSVIFEDEHTEFRSYLNDMLALFADAKHTMDEDKLLSVVQDAWNYFPHRSLDGRSPAEVLAELS